MGMNENNYGLLQEEEQQQNLIKPCVDFKSRIMRRKRKRCDVNS